MESFFLAETTKYLYLLFDPGNFLHDTGSSGTVINTPWGQCVVQAGGYVFNTGNSIMFWVLCMTRLELLDCGLLVLFSAVSKGI
jgi:hypothetical protein